MRAGDGGAHRAAAQPVFCAARTLYSAGIQAAPGQPDGRHKNCIRSNAFHAGAKPYLRTALWPAGVRAGPGRRCCGGAAACGFCVPAAVYGVSVLHLFYAAENGGTGNAAAAAPWVQDHAGRGMETVLPAAGRQAHALCAGGKSIGRGTREYR